MKSVCEQIYQIQPDERKQKIVEHMASMGQAESRNKRCPIKRSRNESALQRDKIFRVMISFQTTIKMLERWTMSASG